MANTKKFIVKNGVQAPNITFKDSNTGATITATMNDSTDTLSFEGDAGQLFSITDGFDGTIFSVNDISGIPSIEVDDEGIIKLAEYNGKVLINTTDSGSASSDVLVVGGNITTHDGSIFFDSAGNSARLQLTHSTQQSSDVLQIQTDDGYILIGPQNTGYAHLVTDRPRFYFGQQVMLGDNHLTSYLGDLILSRAENATHRIVISDSDTQIHNGVLRIDQDTAPSSTANKLYNVSGSLFWNGTNISSGGGGGLDSAEILTVSGATTGFREYNGGVTYDPSTSGGGGDTATDVGIALGSGTRIVGHTAGYIRTLLEWNASSTLEIGDNSTSFIQHTKIYGGASHGVELYEGTNKKLETTSTGVTVTGLLSATTKSFDIEHPTKEGMRLRYGSLEGPENGVYVRGRLKNQNVIELPDYWDGLVHEETITVELTSIGKHQKLYVKDISDNMINIGNGNMVSKEIDCLYIVYGERKDVERFEVEYEDQV